MRKYLLRWLLVLALALHGGTCLAATGDVSIAIVDFQVNGVADYLGSSVSEMLRTGFVGTPGVVVVERAQLAAIAEEHKLNISGLVEEKTAVNLGKLLGANFVILGSVNKLGGVVVLAARIVDVATGASVRGFQSPSPSGEAGIYGAVEKLRGDILRVLAPQKSVAGASPQPTRTPTRGVVVQQQGGEGNFLDGAVPKYTMKESTWAEKSRVLTFWFRYEEFSREARKNTIFEVAAHVTGDGESSYPGVAINNGASDVGFYLDADGNANVFYTKGSVEPEVVVGKIISAGVTYPADLAVLCDTDGGFFEFFVNGDSIGRFDPKDIGTKPFFGVKKGAAILGSRSAKPSSIQVSLPTLSARRP